MFNLYPEDTHFTTTAKVRVRNTTTGQLTTQSLTGRTDGKVSFYTVTIDVNGEEVLTKLAPTELTLIESTNGATYFATWQSTLLRSSFSAVEDGARIAREVAFGDDFAEIEYGYWHKYRP